MTNILITGGCGFVGSNLAVALAREGHAVTCFDNLSRRGSEVLLGRVREHGCRFVHGDIRSMEDFGKLRDEYEVVIECSAEPSALVGSDGRDARYMINNNLLGSINCFEFARERGSGILFFSSSRVYPYNRINALRFHETETRFELAGDGDGSGMIGVSDAGVSVAMPLGGYRSLYGATKLAGEYILQEYAANYNVPCIIDRCGVIAGPWQLGKVDQGVFTFWLAGHYFRRELKYIGFGGRGKQVRDLLHIDDLAELVKLQIGRLGEFRGEVFNAGGARLANLSLAETTTLCGELTGNTLAIAPDAHDRPADVIWYITDNSGIETFGWRPRRDARAILTDTYEWLRGNEATFRGLLGS